MNRRVFISSSMAVGGLAILSRLPSWARPNDGGTNLGQAQDAKTKSKGIKKVTKSDAEWKAQLTPEQYDVLRHEGTEYAFSSPLNDIHAQGTFVCAGCELPVFSSAQKFDSGTGWPSFWAPINKENVSEETDRSVGMTRTKVACAQCGGHLGHVFD